MSVTLDRRSHGDPSAARRPSETASRSRRATYAVYGISAVSAMPAVPESDVIQIR